jgi:hypothetical protein
MTRTPESHRHTAAVCRGEAEARLSRDPAFAAVLARWADRADARARQAEREEQPDLFGAAA